MSLRTQIRNAIDDVAPPPSDLKSRVTAFVLADEKERRNLLRRPRASWSRQLRAPLALVAAALVVALIGGLFVAGRIWRNENLPPQTISQPELKSLESRPLNYPTVAPGSACPSSPELLQRFGMAYGNGPVYVGNVNWLQATDWGTWYSIQVAYDVKRDGLVLIRARDLKSNAEIAFATYPLSPTGIVAIGPVLGQVDAVSHTVQLRSEAAFQDPSHTARMDKIGDLPPLLVLLGFQSGSSGCIGFQLDGPGFSENLVLGP